MEQTTTMRIVECVSHRRDDLDHVDGGHAGRIVLAKQLPGVRTIDVVHRDPQLALELTTIMDTHDMRVVERGGKLRFPIEASPEL